MSMDKEFLTIEAGIAKYLDHDIEVCGTCYYRWLMADVAKKILDTGDYNNGIKRWADEIIRLWKESKYYKLHLLESEAGRDPRIAFMERGWTP